MDAIVKPWPKDASKDANPPLSDHVRAAPTPVADRPSREQAEAAVGRLREDSGTELGDVIEVSPSFFSTRMFGAALIDFANCPPHSAVANRRKLPWWLLLAKNPGPSP